MKPLENLQKFTAIVEADKERQLKELMDCYESGECSIRIQSLLSQLVITNCRLMQIVMELRTP